MSSLTDHELVQQIQLGQSEALGHLYDRYGANIFDFLSRVIGDPDEAIPLLINVFVRLPETIPLIQKEESIRSALFSLAHENALAYLRKRGWLEALPPLTPLNNTATDLANDIWQTARAMPAAQRAILAIVEHQALLPSEQAAALGIAHHSLTDVTAEARRTFKELFDLHARAQGKPTSSTIDAEKVPGLQRRNPDLNASLFTFLPTVVLLDAAQTRVRNQIVSSLGAPVQAVMPAPMPVQPMPTEPVADRDWIPIYVGLAILALFLCAIISVIFINNSKSTANAQINPPGIQQVDPPDGAVLPSGKGVIVQAIFSNASAVDLKSVRMILDSRDITAAATVTGASVSYSGDLGPGEHIVIVNLKDTAGNQVNRAWRFTVAGFTLTPSLTPLPTPTGLPTATPPATATHAPTPTPMPSLTPTALPPLSDLTVMDISLSPNNEIVYVITNIGKGDVPAPFLIRVLVDGVVIDSNRKVSSLGAGQEASLFVPNYRLSGTHSVMVNVNLDRSIQESNYGNNELTQTLTGPTPTPTLTPSLTSTRSPTPK